MQELDEFINKVSHLPPAPKILPELLTLLGRDDVDTGRVVNLITYDAALTAGVLQISNSAFFGAATPVSDLNEAMNRVGFRQVYQMVCAILVSKSLAPKMTGYGIDEGELWRHSVTTAIASQLIARETGVDENSAFTGGLLHDVGKVVLSQALETRYIQLIEEVEKSEISLIEAEKLLLGVQHAEIGGRLLARWKFATGLVTAVWFHHNPGAAESHKKLASCLYLGNMISHFMGFGFGYQSLAVKGRAEALEALKIDADSLPRFMIQVHEEFAAIEALLGAAK